MRVENNLLQNINTNYIPYFIGHRDFRVAWKGGVILPTYNDYFGNDGGYIAVYTRETENVAYSVGGGINVVAQVRVKGHYSGRIFIPEGYYPGDNITRDPQLLAICRKYLPEWEDKDIWVGGDTGGWFGLRGEIQNTDSQGPYD